MYVYRYEFIDGCKYPHTGIIAGLREVFKDDMDTAFELVDPFEENLPNPDPRYDQNDCYCFFTEYGNMVLLSAIEAIIRKAHERGIRCKVYIYNENYVGDIVYRDEFQIIAKTKFIS